ncbi:MAG: hypothetical protein COA97_08235 [Flavobacteriales bacterium]|nr:MAG: hypothetical protein COA97_08235 [Flavobacteriales bacterium]
MDINYGHILKKGVNSIVIQAISITITLILNWYLAKKLGPSDYGVFTYAFSWVYLFGTISMLGLGSVIQREIIRYVPEKIVELIIFSRKTSLVISLIIVSVFSSIVYFFIPEIDNKLLKALLLAILSLPIFSQLLINKAACIGLKKVEHSLLPENIIRPFIFLITIIIVWEFFSPISINSAIITNLFSILIAFIVSYYLLSKFILKMNNLPTYENKKWMRLGFTFLLLTVTIAINSRADILMLGFFGHTDKVGIYNIAVKFSAFIALPLLIANRILVPYISKYFETQKEKLSVMIKKIIRLVFALGSIGFLVFIFIGGELLSFFGKEFEIAYWSLILLSTGQLINIFVGPVGNVLTMSNYEKIALKSMVISAILNILLNVILIPIYDINGAAIATCTSLVFWNIAQFVLVKKKLNMNLSVV